MFAQDRDLLVLEPTLFRDVGWVGQRLVKGYASISGTTLTLSSHDNDFEAAGVGAGHVVTFEGAGYEVLSRTSATVLEVSRARESVDAAAVPPAPAGSTPFEIVTFGPQLGVVHRRALRMIGIDADAPADPEVLGESAVVNPDSLRVVEALGALHLIWSAASASSGPGSPQGRRAEEYRSRYEAERRRAAALLDTDGDGLADATRRLNAVRFVRG